MKRYITLPNIIYFVLTSILLNSYMVVKAAPYTLIFMIPLFLLLNLLPGMNPKGTKSLRLKICNHGTLILMMFVGSLIPSLGWHIVLAFLTIPNSYMDLVWSAVYCIVASAILFWNGILSCVDCDSGIYGTVFL